MISTLAFVFETLRLVTRPLIFAALLYVVWAGLTRARFDARTRLVTWLAVTIPLLAWFAVVTVLAQNDAFAVIPGRRTPSIPLAVLLPLITALPLLLRSNRIAALLDAAPPYWLVAIQAVRVLGGIFVVRWAQGALPGAFALPAGFGDMLVGVLAVPTALRLASGARGSLSAGIAWNILGITDLVIATTMGILTSPTPIQMFGFDHPNAIGSDPSIVMIPIFFVPLFLIMHALSIKQLRRAAATEGPAPQLMNAKSA